MKKTQLVVLAAGIGSRYGGLKQIEPFGLHEEAILEFSAYDAAKAGFSEVVFIIKKEIEKDFKELIGKRVEKLMNVRYAFQEADLLPEGFNLPKNRSKPWGTAHALLCARNEIDSPFVIINADDYYGKKGFFVLREHLEKSDDFAMAAYSVENTLSETGKVTRGVCKLKDGFLEDIDEDHEVVKGSYPDKTPVSMNMWALNEKIFDPLEEYFEDFLKENAEEPKSEFLLPVTIGRGIKEGKWRVKAYPINEKWYGITYRQDAKTVRAALQKMQAEGLY